MKALSVLAAGAAVLIGAVVLARNPTTAETSAASGARWTVDYGNSRIGFSGMQTGQAFDGAFGKFEAAIEFDPSDLSTAAIDVVVDMSSARTGDRQRDAALLGSDWFRTKDFPMARFASDRVEKTGVTAYIARGALTIRGVSKPVDLPFSLTIDGDRARAVGETSLIRTEFGVGQGEFAGDDWVALDVRVRIDVVATR